MANTFALGIEISADPAKAKAGLAEMRRALLQTYSDTRDQVAKLNETLEQAKAKAAEMGKALGSSGPPTKAMVADFDRARAAVNAAQAAVENNSRALQQTRLAAREAASAIAAMAKVEQDAAASASAAASARSAAQASRGAAAANAGSLGLLGVRSGTDIRAEVADANRAVRTLRENGAAASDIARASQAAQARIAALNVELKGAVAAGSAASGAYAGVATRMAAMAAAALAAREAVQYLKSTVETGIKFDSLKTQYTFANSGDTRKAADEMAYAAQLSNRLGLELIGTTQAYGKLQAASRGTALEGKATRDIFTAVASAASVNGLAAEEQAGALLAVSQMMSKGTVSAEELRGQLGERLPGAFSIAAKAMNVTEAELGKLLETGTLTASEFLPRFAEALQESVNSALPAAEKSARAQLQRLENAFTEFKLRISSSGLLDKVAEQLERLLAYIGDLADSGELERMATSFADAFGKIITLAADTAIVAERFSGVFLALGAAMTSAAVGARLLGISGTAAAAGIAASGTAAGIAAPAIGLFAAALRAIPGVALGAAVIYGVEKLIEWGASASEARAKAQALDAELRRLIDSNNEHASSARLDADSLAEFGDTAFAAYEKAITGARDYAAAKVVQLTQENKDGRLDDAIAYYREQARAYNEFIDTVLKGEKLRREQVKLTGQLLAKEAEREKLLAGEVKKTRKEAIDEQIKDYEKLIDAIRKAREESQKEAEEARKKADDLRERAAGKRESAGDKATQIREKDLPAEEKQALDLGRALDAQSQGSYAAAKAGVAQLEGRGKDFEKYAKESEKFLDRAMKFAESAQDANLIEEIGGQQAGLDNTLAKAEDKKAAEAEQRATGLIDQLNTAQAKLKELQGEAATIKIDADITAAVNKLAEVETALAKLQDKTVTVTVNTVQAGAAPAAVPTPDAGPLPEFSFGGPLPGSAPHDRADNRLYWGTPGEWVIQRPAVRHYGAAFIAAVNAMKLPKFASGGQIGASAIDRLRVPAMPAAATSAAARNLTLVLGGERYEVGAGNETIDRLTSYVSREALRKGGRR
ncbi:MAG: tape measure protein [Chitinophagaceae bacterium]|nr:tape measure protein [Chitinophagaceae bacterium]